jgi:hypothetical protein
MNTTSSSPKDIFERLPQEKDLIEQARLISYLYKEQFYTIKELALHLKKHPSFVSHLMRIITLPELILDGYYSKTVSIAHLMSISRLRNETQMISAYKQILSQNLSSLETELLIRELKFGVSTGGKRLSKTDIDELKKRWEIIYKDAEIQIHQSQVKGKVVIEIIGNPEKTTEFIRQIIDVMSPPNDQYEEETHDILE